MKRRWKFRIDKVALYAVLIVSSLAMAYPFLVMILGSVGTIDDYYLNPSLPIPTRFTLQNYLVILNPASVVGVGAISATSATFLRWTANTLFRIGWYLVVPGVTSILGGYTLARLRWKGREGIFTYLLSSMVLPAIVYTIPTYVMVARFPLAGGNNILGQGGTGFMNQWPALLITGWVNVYFIFMFRQTLASIPADFEEAARVDGATTFQCLAYIYLPMLRPVLVVLFINTFVGYWNDFIWPLFVASGNPDIMPISLGFQYLYMAGNALKGKPPTYNDIPFALAVGVVSILPCAVLYLFLQRYFVEGVQGFAIKG
jgi:multiple sugar transport system permease protein